jgi:hypothetical protein
MIVIARNNGPKYLNGYLYNPLLKGKEYEVIYWSIPEWLNNGKCIDQLDDFINPKEAKFFIVVKDEFGKESSFWNDYFLSTEEMREYKLNKILT